MEFEGEEAEHIAELAGNVTRCRMRLEDAVCASLKAPEEDVCVYIGDGASLTRGLLRKKGKKVLGHASIRSQLEWCAEHGVRRAFFTHCGTEIVSQDGRGAARGLRVLAREFGVTTKFAHDSMQTAISKGA